MVMKKLSLARNWSLLNSNGKSVVLRSIHKIKQFSSNFHVFETHDAITKNAWSHQHSQFWGTKQWNLSCKTGIAWRVPRDQAVNFSFTQHNCAENSMTMGDYFWNLRVLQQILSINREIATKYLGASLLKTLAPNILHSSTKEKPEIYKPYQSDGQYRMPHRSLSAVKSTFIASQSWRKKVLLVENSVSHLWNKGFGLVGCFYDISVLT